MRSNLRRDYRLKRASSKELDPIKQFAAWFRSAIRAKMIEPNAAVLATVSKKGIPSARVILVKHFNKQGFIFFTNYQSRKGLDLAANRAAALVFFWDKLERQVRIEGIIERISTTQSKRYFALRPRGAQIAAWASSQSSIITNRAMLKSKFRYFEKLFAGRKIPCPTYWGGYRLKPSTIEFWQGQPDRLHTRVKFIKRGKESWKFELLSP